MLDLVPATMPHHMSTLFSAGFVEGSPKDGKTHYRLYPEGAQRYRDWLECSFL